MARGDECKTAVKATHACKQFDVAAPMKKPAETSKYQQAAAVKKPETKNYGSWGPIFKDKQTFASMHHC